jgi:Tfp pilus assembly protein PilF
LRVGDYIAAQSSVAKALAIDPSNSAAQQLREQIIHRRGGTN